jgi:site-specific recombinase XerD
MTSQELIISDAGQGVAKNGCAGSALPPILEGCYTLAVEDKTRRFVAGVPEMLERWISRRSSPHTQRAYRQDLFAFIGFAGLHWPDEAAKLFSVDVKDFQPDDANPTLRITEKGHRRRTIGLNILAAQAVAEYLAKAGI